MEYKGTGVHGFLTNLFFDVIYFPQNIFSVIYAFVIVKSCLFFVKRRAGYVKEYENGFTVIDLNNCLRWPDKQMWKILRFAFRSNAAIAGYSSERWFERLVSWNGSIAIRGFVGGKPSFRINGLFEEVEKEEGRIFKRAEYLDYQKLDYLGKFLILKREMIRTPGSSIPDSYLNCIWISGKYSGMGFTLSRYSNWRFENPLVPRVIHFPPKFVVAIFYFSLSTSSIYAFSKAALNVTKTYWPMICNALK